MKTFYLLKLEDRGCRRISVECRWNVYALSLNELAQPEQRFVPLLRDRIEEAASLCDTPLIQIPNVFPSARRAVNEACSFHYPQVLRDGLTSDLGAGGEPGDGHRPLMAEPEDEV